MKQDFVHPGAAVFLFSCSVLLLMLVNCSGVGDLATSDGIVIVQHSVEDIPTSVDHVRYATLDDNGNRIYLPSVFPPSDVHQLEGIPKNTRAIVTEFHTEESEELHEDISPISFMDSAAAISVQYSQTQFLARRLAIVDMDEPTGNILVRGNLPLVKKEMGACYPGQDRCFAYDGENSINAAMKERIKEIDPGFDIANYDVIEIVLHGGAGTGNKEELIVEMNALGLDISNIPCGAQWPIQDCDDGWHPKNMFYKTTEDKKLWALAWWPMYNCDKIPCENVDEKIPGYTETRIALEKFHFSEAPSFLKTLLTTPSVSGKPKLIYFHCIQGADRTGTLHIAYIMDNNPEMSFTEALDRAWKGKREGSDKAQLDYLHDDVKPMCKFVGIAYRYCQEKNKDNPDVRCGTPDEFKNYNCKQP